PLVISFRCQKTWPTPDPALPLKTSIPHQPEVVGRRRIQSAPDTRVRARLLLEWCLDSFVPKPRFCHQAITTIYVKSR
ncbi:hypothetical protein AVEN_207714-1, partial [Araneus ventricosus]